METIGLIAAMAQESQALLRCLQGRERIALASFRGFRFRLQDRNCLLLTSGMGLLRAAQGARTLLACADLSLLVSFGIAGAVEADLEVGDVVVPGKVCQLENGRPGPLQPLAALSGPAWEASARRLQADGARLVVGTAVSTRGSQVVGQAIRELAHPVLEMETAAIARVAAERGIPLLSIRAISDGPRSPLPFDLEAVLDERYHFRIGRMALVVLRNPRILLRARQMMQNSRLAADHAARALVAALSQANPILLS